MYNIPFKQLFFVIIFISFSGKVFNQTHYARTSGDWDNTNVWSTVSVGGVSCGCIPGAGDNVLIDGYDIDIDAANVTISDIEITSVSGDDVRLRVQQGKTLTVNNDFKIKNNSAGSDARLIIEDNNSGLDVTGDFFVDANDGADIMIDVDDNCQLNVAGNFDVDQDGGDDVIIRLNGNSGNAGQIIIVGNFIFEHNGGDDLNISLEGTSSLLGVGGSATINLNSGSGDKVIFDLEEGNLVVIGSFNLNRALTAGKIFVDMDGGNLTANGIVITSGGDLFTDGAIHFYIDESSVVTANSMTATMTGGDDFFIWINQNAGNTGQLNIAGNFSITRTDGDDIEIRVEEDGSRFNVGGNTTITTTGGEDFDIIMDNEGQWVTNGNFTITSIGGDNGEIYLDGGSDNPSFKVNGNFTWTNSTGDMDQEIDLNGGVFFVGANLILTNSAGADDIDLKIDEVAVMNVSGNFIGLINGGDEVRINIGVSTAGTTSELNVGGDMILDQNNNLAGSFWAVNVEEDSRINVAGDLTLTTRFTNPSKSRFTIRNTAELSVTGNINLNAVAAGELEIKMLNTSWLRIGGNFVRAASPNNFGKLDCTSGSSTVEYKGTSTQFFAEDDGGGGDFFYYENVEINNTFATSPQLTMEGLASIHGNIAFTDGVILSNATDILVVVNNATVSTAKDESHVDGFVRKIGNDPFVFPVGNAGFYAPSAISAPGSSSDQFESQYIKSQPHGAGFDRSMKDVTINHISNEEYWFVNRTNGASNVNVTLSWNTPRSGGVTNLSDMLVVRWNGASWKDHGNGGTTGTLIAGTIITSAAVTSFSPFTLASTTANNPLPIELIEFDANTNSDRVDLKWITATEINNDYFNVERSVDGKNWEEVLTTNGAGNSHQVLEYFEVDYEPLEGLSYYRLKQTDYNGKFSYSSIIPVKFLANATSGIINLFPNPVSNGATLRLEFKNIVESEILVVIRDMQGREFYSKIVVNIENGTLIGVPISKFIPKGVYLITASSENMVYSQKLIIK